eukprot:GSA25T00027603001.1
MRGAARDGAAAGLQHPATRARLGRACSTSASNSSAMSTATAMDELSFADLPTGSSGVPQPETVDAAAVGALMIQIRDARALMEEGTATSSAFRAFSEVILKYQAMNKNIKAREQKARHEFLRISLLSLKIYWFDLRGDARSDARLEPRAERAFNNDVFWTDEGFVLEAMRAMSCWEDTDAPNGCKSADVGGAPHSGPWVVRYIYRNKVSLALRESSVDTLAAFFRFGTGPVNGRDQLDLFLPSWKRARGWFGGRDASENCRLLPDVASRFFGSTDQSCSSSNLTPDKIRAFAALGAQLNSASAKSVPEHLRICPAVVAGLLAAD